MLSYATGVARLAYVAKVAVEGHRCWPVWRPQWAAGAFGGGWWVLGHVAVGKAAAGCWRRTR